MIPDENQTNQNKRQTEKMPPAGRTPGGSSVLKSLLQEPPWSAQQEDSPVTGGLLLHPSQTKITLLKKNRVKFKVLV